MITNKKLIAVICDLEFSELESLLSLKKALKEDPEIKEEQTAELLRDAILTNEDLHSALRERKAVQIGINHQLAAAIKGLNGRFSLLVALRAAEAERLRIIDTASNFFREEMKHVHRVAESLTDRPDQQQSFYLRAGKIALVINKCCQMLQ